MSRVGGRVRQAGSVRATVAGYLLHTDRVHRWAPTAPALFHLALVHVHGRAAVERAEAQVVRRH
ncbi:hypothetical protein [Streptomyces sp. NPDC091278]|uniref:hypothetical protein n=1 Tax=Streptomyces sp. NPDC091278 TaxID=3155301 RepID=UPI00344D9AB8